MMAANTLQSLLCPQGNPILFVEFHDDKPHSVITESSTYDIEYIDDGGYLLYRDVGSGCRNRTVSLGRLCDPSKPASFWVAPDVTVVGDDGDKMPLTVETARVRGFVRVEEIANPFEDALGGPISEGRAIYCSVTGKAWDEEYPSPYMRYLDEAGEWGGCGAGVDYIGEEASQHSMVDLAMILGAAKARKLADALPEIKNFKSTPGFTFEYDYRDEEMLVTLADYRRFKFNCKAAQLPIIEAAIAWIESVDGEAGLSCACQAANWLNDAARKLTLLREARKLVKGGIPVGMRKLWKEISRTVCLTDYPQGRRLIEAFLKTIRAV